MVSRCLTEVKFMKKLINLYQILDQEINCGNLQKLNKFKSKLIFSEVWKDANNKNDSLQYINNFNLLKKLIKLGQKRVPH